jgi:hypothetical protein
MAYEAVDGLGEGAVVSAVIHQQSHSQPNCGFEVHMLQAYSQQACTCA